VELRGATDWGYAYKKFVGYARVSGSSECVMFGGTEGGMDWCMCAVGQQVD